MCTLGCSLSFHYPGYFPSPSFLAAFIWVASSLLFSFFFQWLSSGLRLPLLFLSAFFPFQWLSSRLPLLSFLFSGLHPCCSPILCCYPPFQRLSSWLFPVVPSCSFPCLFLFLHFPYLLLAS